MIYLIRTFGRCDNQTSLKVGFSDNLNQRLSSYKTQNPFFELITTRGGTILDETRIHTYLKFLNLKEDFLNEWFLDSDLVYQRFHDSFEKMNSVIWNNRSKIFTESDFKTESSIRYKLYEELRLVNSWNMKITSIDMIYKNQINKKIIKKYKNYE